MNMITCREFIEFLMDYIEDDLPQTRREVFEGHISLCPSCHAYLKTYEETVRLGKEAMTTDCNQVPDSVPKDLIAAILAAKNA